MKSDIALMVGSFCCGMTCKVFGLSFLQMLALCGVALATYLAVDYFKDNP